MIFNLIYFLPAIALLWLPLPYVARKDRAYNGRARITPSTISGLWRAWQNWVDLLRAAAGTYALLHLSIQIGAPGTDPSVVNYVKDGVLLVGVLMQTIRFGSAPGFLAPLFYLTGITIILPGYIEGGFAVVLAWAFACGTRDPRLMLPILTAGLLIGGYFLSGLSRPLLTNVGLALLPLFLALLLQHRVCFVSRERKIADIPKEPVAPRPSKRNEIRRALKSRPSTVER